MSQDILTSLTWLSNIRFANLGSNRQEVLSLTEAMIPSAPHHCLFPPPSLLNGTPPIQPVTQVNSEVTSIPFVSHPISNPPCNYNLPKASSR